MAALVLGVIAGLLLGADGAEFAKTWIAPFGAIFMNMIKMTIVDCPLRRYFYEHD